MKIVFDLILFCAMETIAEATALVQKRDFREGGGRSRRYGLLLSLIAWPTEDTATSLPHVGTNWQGSVDGRPLGLQTCP